MSEDYADRFCELFDRLDPALFRAEGEAWMADAPGDPAGEPGSPREAFAVLRGIDAALAHANPATGEAAPPALTEYALRYVEAGRLDSGAVGGALLPRFARPG